MIRRQAVEDASETIRYWGKGPPFHPYSLPYWKVFKRPLTLEEKITYIEAYLYRIRIEIRKVRNDNPKTNEKKTQKN